MEIRARHFLGQNAQQVHHIAKAELQLIGRLLFCLGEDAVHGIVRDLGIQPAERHDRRLRRDVKPFELHIRIRHQIDIGAAVHATLGNLEHFAVIRQIAVAVERAEVDERVRLQAVVQTVDRQRAAAAADEQERVCEFRYPLVEWEMAEADCLAYCRARGFDWGGLYDLFRRVSCWCCPLQPLSELRILRKHFPELWEKLRYMDAHTWRQFRADYSVEQLEQRFALEEERAVQGLPLKGRAFYAALKNRLGENAGEKGGSS